MFRYLASALTRRKKIDEKSVEETKLNRVLGIVDITSLGIGSTLGAGVYVLTGAVAKDIAGPAVIISFLVAALTSLLAGLCYAEFGARVPKAGSVYIYCYVTVGELVAFTIGWFMLLTYVIGSAGVAKAWTANFDALPFMNKSIENYLRDCCSMNTPGIAEWPDLLALAVILIITALIALGAKEFASVNKVFTVINILVIICITLTAFTMSDLSNWSWSPQDIYYETIGNSSFSNSSTFASNLEPWQDSEFKEKYGVGGFMPFGFSGVLSGTATCIFAFVGFDCIAATGDEVKNPQKAIPIAIVVCLAVCSLAYIGISSSLLLMVPYFKLDANAPFPYAFENAGLNWATYPLTIGAMCALSTSLLGSMFPMPRIIWAMAEDGLLFKCFKNVHPRTKTPLIATLVTGAFAGLMAVLFDLKELVDLMSIGTFGAYTLVAFSILILRYQPQYDSKVAEYRAFSLKLCIRPSTSEPNRNSQQIVRWSLAIAVASMLGFSICLRSVDEAGPSTAVYVLCGLFTAIIVSAFVVMSCQPQSPATSSFNVPLVPFIPLFNMWINICLMVYLPAATWYKMAIWMMAGFLIYFFYGVWNSAEKPTDRRHEENDQL